MFFVVVVGGGTKGQRLAQQIGGWLFVCHEGRRRRAADEYHDNRCGWVGEKRYENLPLRSGPLACSSKRSGDCAFCSCPKEGSALAHRRWEESAMLARLSPRTSLSTLSFSPPPRPRPSSSACMRRPAEPWPWRRPRRRSAPEGAGGSEGSGAVGTRRCWAAAAAPPRGERCRWTRGRTKRAWPGRSPVRGRPSARGRGGRGYRCLFLGGGGDFGGFFSRRTAAASF